MLFLICYTILRFYSKGKKESQLKISGFLNGCAARLGTNLFGKFVLLLIPLIAYPQASSLNYKIMYKGDAIGWMKLERNIEGDKSDMSLVSEIKTRVIVPVKINVEELATFEDGKLIYSSQLRKTNGKVKTDSKTKLLSGKYEVTENGVRNSFSYPAIKANLLSLFFEEPVAKEMVFVEKQQRFLRIVKTDDGGYQLKFPNGNKNCFYYSKGICTKVKVQHNLYAVEVIFTP